MAMGRPRLPVERKKLQGTFRADQENPDAPEPALLDTPPRCPSHLKGEARKEWRKLAQILIDLRVLSLGDLDALAAYCTHYQIWIDAKAKVQEHGAVIANPKTGWFEISPFLKVADDASSRMKQFMVEFGMTPASRSRVKAGKRPTMTEKDTDAQYFDAEAKVLRKS
jgi:P27 family predicted phage terminase small subunit